MKQVNSRKFTDMLTLNVLQENITLMQVVWIPKNVNPTPAQMSRTSGLAFL